MPHILPMNDIVISDSLVLLNDRLGQHVIKLVDQAIADHGSFHMALSGGNTPQAFYQLLSTLPYRQEIPWDKVHIYQTDERFVPSDHPDNNFAMIRRLLINPMNLSACHQHPIKTDHCTPSESAQSYHKELMQWLPVDNGFPQFDYMLLGLGVDGHIASLFPGYCLGFDSSQLVMSYDIKHLHSQRISLTLPLINHTKHIAVIVAGVEKSAMIEAIFYPPKQPLYPIHHLHAVDSIQWFLDKAAAQKILHRSAFLLANGE